MSSKANWANIEAKLAKTSKPEPVKTKKRPLKKKIAMALV